MRTYGWNKPNALLFLLCALASHGAAAGGNLQQNEQPPESQLLEHWLPSGPDGCPSPLYMLVLEQPSGEFLVRLLDLRMLGVTPPDTHVLQLHGERYYALADVSNLSLAADESRLQLRNGSQHSPEDLCDPDLTDTQPEELLLTLSVNHEPQPGVTLALHHDLHQLLLSIRDLKNLRVRAPEQILFTFHGDEFLPLSALAGVEYTLDRRRMTLDLTLPPKWLDGSTRTPEQRTPAMSADSDAGIFLNYDLNTEYQESTFRDKNASSGGIFELGIFNKIGLLTQTGLYRKTDRTDESLRLETTWRQDNPERMTTLIVGDSQAQPGSWGNAVRFGGISWGTNFSTRPDLVTFPLPSIAGEAATASTVDIYVNNVRRASTDVPAGPFIIDELPIITGAGNVQLVTMDLLGRETMISQPFYGSRALLRPGLHDYNVTVGSLRNDYGRESDRYGDSFISTTHRVGFTRWLTGELRVEAAEEVQTYGAAASIAIARVGAMHWTSAHSQGRDNTSGQLTEVRLERNGRRFSMGARTRITSPRFRQVAHTEALLGATRTSQAYASARLNRFGSLSLSYVDRRTERLKNQIIGVGYNTHLGGFATLSVNASHNLNGSRDTFYRASLVIPLGGNLTASSSAHTRGDRQQGRVTLRRTPPARKGFGFRAEQSWGDRNDQALYTELRTSRGSYRAAAVMRPQGAAYRAGARGGFAYLGQRLFASDWIRGSFAAVQAPGLAGTPVYRENLYVTDTRSNGWALVTGLRPFEHNRIRLDERDLPLDVQLNKNEGDLLVPGYRRGLTVNFDVRHSRAATLTLTNAEGEPLPPGTQVIAEATNETFTVGWEGMTYLSGLGKRTYFTAQWSSHQCQFTLDYPDTSDPLPELGTHVCTN